ncbi:MAG: hypothetical protein IJG13_07455 [Kiritimatiellae bacterium]|nr:hypothetical protein [Kiritimatiellia bacterium]MBQ3341155.1 hypothetical protein [Kiritimatiellia bacterium]MBQ6330675.1 hypothetical protein [Kiritimatiellia bacterium]
MKRLMLAGVVAASICTITGCMTTIDDCFRSDLKTQLVPAKFKPTVEVMKEKGVVKGEATKSYWFWFFPHETPNSFAHEIDDGVGGLMIPSVYNAAVYDACRKSGASILLAPRFTEVETTGFLWFCGSKTVSVEGVPARIVGAEEIPVEQWPVLFGANSGTVKTISK